MKRLMDPAAARMSRARMNGAYVSKSAVKPGRGGQQKRCSSRIFPSQSAA